jgi:thioredoxin-like negative regulator of GroEL
MKYLDLKLLVVFILVLIVGSKATGQEFINQDNFNQKIAKDIVAVEFWVEWNSSNEFVDLSNLNDCSKYRIDIAEYPDIQAKYEVTCIPTVIIFESGEEKERFRANIMFELEANKKEVQERIDQIMIAKFN